MLGPVVLVILCAIVGASGQASIINVRGLYLGACPSFASVPENTLPTLAPFIFVGPIRTFQLTPGQPYCFEWTFTVTVTPTVDTITIGPMIVTGPPGFFYVDPSTINPSGLTLLPCPAGGDASSTPCAFAPGQPEGLLNSFRYTYTPPYSCTAHLNNTVTLNPQDSGNDGFPGNGVTFSIAALCPTASITAGADAIKASE
jgi:hypothetical protein